MGIVIRSPLSRSKAAGKLYTHKGMARSEAEILVFF